MVGIIRQWTALESYAAAGTLGALRAATREDSQGRPLLRRRPDLPEGWDDSLIYEIAAALAMGPVSAGNLAGLAWTLGTRLPGIGRLLADGTLTKPKAKLIAATFAPLTESEAARAEALILGDLPGKTWFQVERLAWRAALAVAPDIAERRRTDAERRRARVTVFREESGAAGLSGRDLPDRAGPVRPRQRPRPRPPVRDCPARSPTTTRAACRPWPTSTSSTTSPPRTRSRSPAPPPPNRHPTPPRPTQTTTTKTASDPDDGDPDGGDPDGEDPATGIRAATHPGGETRTASNRAMGTRTERNPGGGTGSGTDAPGNDPSQDNDDDDGPDGDGDDPGNGDPGSGDPDGGAGAVPAATQGRQTTAAVMPAQTEPGALRCCPR